MLSVNGSPLANPLSLDLSGWLSRHRAIDNDEPDSLRNKGVGPQERKRTASIVVRSASFTSNAGAASSHSRVDVSSTAAGTGKAGVPARSNGLDAKGSFEPISMSLAAVVSVPTADGHLLEFDPFHTSPSEIDALEGISSSAKMKAKEDMRSLVRQAAERWRIE